jgi:hypothetical protein
VKDRRCPDHTSFQRISVIPHEHPVQKLTPGTDILWLLVIKIHSKPNFESATPYKGMDIKYEFNYAYQGFSLWF